MLVRTFPRTRGVAQKALCSGTVSVTPIVGASGRSARRAAAVAAVHASSAALRGGGAAPRRFYAYRRRSSPLEPSSDTKRIISSRVSFLDSIVVGQEKLTLTDLDKTEWFRDIGNTSVVRLCKTLYTKNPSGSTKDRMICAMVLRKFMEGSVKEGSTLCLTTSGSAGIALVELIETLKRKKNLNLNAVIAMPKAYMAKPVPQRIAANDAVQIRHTIDEVVPVDGGIQLLLLDDIFMNVLAKVNEAALNQNWLILDQHHDYDAVIAHRSTAMEMQQQIPDLTDVVVGTGTGATAAGLRHFLPPDVLVHSRPAESGAIDGLSDNRRYENYLNTREMVAGYWCGEFFRRDVADAYCGKLVHKHNIAAGPSSGAAYSLAAELALQPGRVVAFIAADGEFKRDAEKERVERICTAAKKAALSVEGLSADPNAVGGVGVGAVLATRPDATPPVATSFPVATTKNEKPRKVLAKFSNFYKHKERIVLRQRVKRAKAPVAPPAPAPASVTPAGPATGAAAAAASISPTAAAAAAAATASATSTGGGGVRPQQLVRELHSRRGRRHFSTTTAAAAAAAASDGDGDVEEHECIVFGGGPVGSSAAMSLCERGKQVLLVHNSKEKGAHEDWSRLARLSFDGDAAEFALSRRACETLDAIDEARAMSSGAAVIPLRPGMLFVASPNTPLARTCARGESFGDAAFVRRAPDELNALYPGNRFDGLPRDTLCWSHPTGYCVSPLELCDMMRGMARSMGLRAVDGRAHFAYDGAAQRFVVDVAGGGGGRHATRNLFLFAGARSKQLLAEAEARSGGALRVPEMERTYITGISTIRYRHTAFAAKQPDIVQQPIILGQLRVPDLVPFEANFSVVPEEMGEVLKTRLSGAAGAETIETVDELHSERLLAQNDTLQRYSQALFGELFPHIEADKPLDFNRCCTYRSHYGAFAGGTTLLEARFGDDGGARLMTTPGCFGVGVKFGPMLGAGAAAQLCGDELEEGVRVVTSGSELQEPEDQIERAW